MAIPHRFSLPLLLPSPSLSSYLLPSSLPSLSSLPLFPPSSYLLPPSLPSLSSYLLPSSLPSLSSYLLPSSLPSLSSYLLPSSLPSLSSYLLPPSLPSLSSYLLPPSLPSLSSYLLPSSLPPSPPTSSLPLFPPSPPTSSLPLFPPSPPTSSLPLFPPSLLLAQNKLQLALCSFQGCLRSPACLLPAIHNCVQVFRLLGNEEAEFDFRLLLIEALERMRFPEIGGRGRMEEDWKACSPQSLAQHLLQVQYSSALRALQCKRSTSLPWRQLV